MIGLIVIAAAVQQCPAEVAIHAGQAVMLETVVPLSSKLRVNGDPVELRTKEPVEIDGIVAIPRGAVASGEIVSAQSTGGLGSSGRLGIRPLYVTVGDRTVRLEGRLQAKRSTGAGSIIGLITLTPVISGRSVLIPAGQQVEASVLKPASVKPAC